MTNMTASKTSCGSTPPFIRLVTAKVDHRRYVLPPQWEKAVSGWLTWMRLRGMSENTLTSRRGQVRLVARLSKTASPDQIDLAALVTLCGRPGPTSDYRQGQRAGLTSFFTWCVDNGMAVHNPAAMLPKVKASAPRPRPTPDDVWVQLLARTGPRETLMALLACEAGLRRAEVATLHYDDLARDPDGWLLIVRGKGNKQRVVPIADHLAKYLRQQCQGGYVFPGAINGHLHPDSVGRLINRLMPRGWTMHKLRHRYATHGFNGTHNLLAVQAALGHSNVSTTQRYTAVAFHDVRAVSEAATRHNRIIKGDNGVEK
jgi:integrase